MSILHALRRVSLTVDKIIKVTGSSQSNASNHLGYLQDCGLANRSQKGNLVYQLSDKRVTVLLNLANAANRVYEYTCYKVSDIEK